MILLLLVTPSHCPLLCSASPLALMLRRHLLEITARASPRIPCHSFRVPASTTFSPGPRLAFNKNFGVFYPIWFALREHFRIPAQHMCTWFGRTLTFGLELTCLGETFPKEFLLSLHSLCYWMETSQRRRFLCCAHASKWCFKLAFALLQ